MAARSRQTWTALIAEIRVLLREDTSASSYWSDADLLLYANLSIDKYIMMLSQQHEGFFVETTSVDTVVNQRNYTLTEGIDKIHRVILVDTVGSGTVETPLTRNEQYSSPVALGVGTGGGTLRAGTFRLIDNEIYLEPPPTTAVTNGLKIEYIYAPARLTVGADKLDLAFPGLFETLLVLEVALMAFAVEAAQGDTPEGGRQDVTLKMMRDEYRGEFFQFTAQRSEGSRVFGSAMHTGD